MKKSTTACFLLWVIYMELIDKNKAVELLEKLKKKQAECGCKGSSERATALGYAIAIIKELEAIKIENDETAR